MLLLGDNVMTTHVPQTQLYLLVRVVEMFTHNGKMHAAL